MGEVLSDATPRVVWTCAPKPPIMLYNDGSCEGAYFENASIGALILVPGQRPEFFSMKVPSELMDLWKQDGTRQVIFQAEILPVVLAKRVWAAKLVDQSVIAFIDNEAARCSLLKSSCRNGTGLHLIHESLRSDIVLRARFWCARVPSASNPADLPSRNAVRETAEEWDALHVMADEVMKCLVKDLSELAVAACAA
eukprot:6492074-Amphidinium_carterae.3